MSRKINIIIIVICTALIIISALYHGRTNTEPFLSDILLAILLKQPCAAVVTVTEAVQLKFRTWKTELIGMAVSLVILFGTAAMSLLMMLQATAEVRTELFITLAVNFAVTAVLYIKMIITKKKGC